MWLSGVYFPSRHITGFIRGHIRDEVIAVKSFRIPHPDMSPLEIPQPEPAPLHPGSERPEITPPDSPPESEQPEK